MPVFQTKTRANVVSFSESMYEPREHVGEAAVGRKAASVREFLSAAYEAHAHELYRHALMLLVDHAAAEDAVHRARPPLPT